jgi:hypothetical protein
LTTIDSLGTALTLLGIGLIVLGATGFIVFGFLKYIREEKIVETLKDRNAKLVAFLVSIFSDVLLFITVIFASAITYAFVNFLAAKKGLAVPSESILPLAASAALIFLAVPTLYSFIEKLDVHTFIIDAYKKFRHRDHPSEDHSSRS